MRDLYNEVDYNRDEVGRILNLEFLYLFEL